jgi:FkbM family methyltransferase
MIGSSIERAGLYDLCVSETLYRLIDPGELAVDVGANIGHMASIMVTRVGKRGRVICFEPHPELFEELAGNAARWAEKPTAAHVGLHQIALSSESGRGHLKISDEFQRNRGTASLTAYERAATTVAESYDVQLGRLDDMFTGADEIGVLKLDVEGHEGAVLRGATRLLSTHKIRDLVFEEHGEYPTEACRLLEAHGYVLFGLVQGLFGLLVSPINKTTKGDQWDPPSYLATTEPDRAIARLRRKGWAVFGLLLSA